MILDIIFVRHGLSCANILSKKQPGRHIFYQDPELSLEGIDNSKDFYDDLIKFIKSKWGETKEEDYIIGASQMIRAQETAFHMLASRVNKDIHVFPYIGEIGITYDNYSSPRDEQRKLLKKPINAGILEKLKSEKDYREPQSLNTKSNFPKFIDWVVNNNNKLRKSGNSVNSETKPPPVKMVIFTHGRFLRSIRDGLAHFENNDAMHVKYETDTKEFIGGPPEIHRINKREPTYECPDDCRVSRCSKEPARNWGSAGRKEQVAIFKSEKAAKKYTDLYNLQKPKTFMNYLKRGLYGVKKIFNKKTFSQRVRSAERNRNILLRNVSRKRLLNRNSRANRNRTSAVKASLNKLTKPKTIKNYLRSGYNSFMSIVKNPSLLEGFLI